MKPSDATFKTVQLPANNRHAAKVRKVQGAVGSKLVDGAPTMLFSKLDASEKQLSKGKMVAELGRISTHLVVLLGPSGAGKTRKLFDLLARRNGFYLVCHSKGGDTNRDQRRSRRF